MTEAQLTARAMELARHLYGEHTELRSLYHDGQQQMWVYDRKGQRVHAARSLTELVRELEAQAPSHLAPMAAPVDDHSAINGGNEMEATASTHQYVDASRASTLTGFSKTAINRNIAEGRLKAEKRVSHVGGSYKYFINVEDLRAWEAAQKANARNRPRKKRGSGSNRMTAGGYASPQAAKRAHLRRYKERTASPMGDGYSAITTNVTQSMRSRMLRICEQLEGTPFETSVTKLVQLGLERILPEFEKVTGRLR